MVEKKTKKKGGDASSSEMPPKMDPITATKARTFATVTSMGNTVTKKVLEEPDQTEKLAILKSGITDCIKQFVSIAFERADVNDLISNDPNFQPLQYFDPSAIFTKDINSLQAAKVMSMITGVQESVQGLSEKCALDTKRHQNILDNFEKV